MSEEEFKVFETLHKKFYERCKYLTKELLPRLNADFHVTDEFYLIENCEDVCCNGYNSLCSGREDVYIYFPAFLLYATDEDVNTYIDLKIEEEKKREKEREEENKRIQREFELKMLARLKDKYESN